MPSFNQKLAHRQLVPKDDQEHVARDAEMLASWSDKMLIDALRVAVDDAELNSSSIGADICAKVRHNTVNEIEKRLNIRRKPMRSAGEWAEFFCKPEDTEVYRLTVVAWIQRIQDDAINRNAPPLH